MTSRHLIIAMLVLGGCDAAATPTTHPPFLISSSPPEGEIVTLSSGEGQRELSAVLGDENLDDTLFIRFLVDYPDGSDSSSHLVYQVTLPPSGGMERAAVRIRPECSRLGLPAGLHRFTLSAADRPFLDPLHGDGVDPEAPLDSVGGDAHRLRAVWLLNCP
jgi:hypothetical protein